MDQVTANRFRDQLKAHVDRAIANHEPLRVTRRRGGDFVIMSLDDFAAEQETIAILKNERLMTQIRSSLRTMESGAGRAVEVDEL